MFFPPLASEKVVGLSPPPPNSSEGGGAKNPSAPPPRLRHPWTQVTPIPNTNPNTSLIKSATPIQFHSQFLHLSNPDRLLPCRPILANKFVSSVKASCMSKMASDANRWSYRSVVTGYSTRGEVCLGRCLTPIDYFPD